MRKVLISVSAILIISVISYMFYHTIWTAQQDFLVYDNEKSNHGSFSIKDGYVVVKDIIYIKNQSDKDIYFFMNADMTKDYGLVTDRFVPAYEEGNFNRKKYLIKANSEGPFSASFKSKNGTRNTKTDRLPPENVEFEIVN